MTVSTQEWANVQGNHAGAIAGQRFASEVGRDIDTMVANLSEQYGVPNPAVGAAIER